MLSEFDHLASAVRDSAAASETPEAFLTENEQKIIDLAKGLAARRIEARDLLTSWSALTDYLALSEIGKGCERFRVMFLDRKNCLIADEVLGEGTVDHAPVYPRNVAKRALELDASAVILTHNHPSGDVTPSSADIEMTRQIVEALRTLRISVHDHVITGAGGKTLSMKQLGLM